MKSDKNNTIKGEFGPSERTGVDRGAETAVQRKSCQVPKERSSTSTPGDLTSSNERMASTNGVDKPIAEDVSHSTRRATGPRTTRGKMRSGRNATKHGIFSRTIVLDGESQIEYESLLFGLRQYFEPVGALEDLLVEQLATNRWRYRRLLVAERAEIEIGAIPVESETPPTGVFKDPISKVAEFTEGGLIATATNSKILPTCIFLLKVLRKLISEGGLKKERDEKALRRLYGSFDPFADNLFRAYSDWLRISELPEDERQSKSHPSPPECREKVLQAIDDETKRLEQLKEERSCAEAERCRVERLRHSIPEGRRGEHLLRYEASLDRSFDRILHQLERAQRMRQGQPVAPPINLRISG